MSTNKITRLDFEDFKKVDYFNVINIPYTLENCLQQWNGRVVNNPFNTKDLLTTLGLTVESLEVFCSFLFSIEKTERTFLDEYCDMIMNSCSLRSGICNLVGILSEDFGEPFALSSIIAALNNKEVKISLVGLYNNLRDQFGYKISLEFYCEFLASLLFAGCDEKFSFTSITGVNLSGDYNMMSPKKALYFRLLNVMNKGQGGFNSKKDIVEFIKLESKEIKIKEKYRNIVPSISLVADSFIISNSDERYSLPSAFSSVRYEPYPLDIFRGIIINIDSFEDLPKGGCIFNDYFVKELFNGLRRVSEYTQLNSDISDWVYKVVKNQRPSAKNIIEEIDPAIMKIIVSFFKELSVGLTSAISYFKEPGYDVCKSSVLVLKNLFRSIGFTSRLSGIEEVGDFLDNISSIDFLISLFHNPFDFKMMRIKNVENAKIWDPNEDEEEDIDFELIKKRSIRPEKVLSGGNRVKLISEVSVEFLDLISRFLKSENNLQWTNQEIGRFMPKNKTSYIIPVMLTSLRDKVKKGEVFLMESLEDSNNFYLQLEEEVDSQYISFVLNVNVDSSEVKIISCLPTEVFLETHIETKGFEGAAIDKFQSLLAARYDKKDKELPSLKFLIRVAESLGGFKGSKVKEKESFIVPVNRSIARLFATTWFILDGEKFEVVWVADSGYWTLYSVWRVNSNEPTYIHKNKDIGNFNFKK